MADIYSYSNPQLEAYKKVRVPTRDEIGGLDVFGYKLTNPLTRDQDVDNLISQSGLPDIDGSIAEKIKGSWNANDAERIIRKAKEAAVLTGTTQDSLRTRDLAMQDTMFRRQLDAQTQSNLQMSTQAAKSNMDIAKLNTSINMEVAQLNARNAAKANAQNFISSLVQRF
jgi:hypothetical protein